ncbi:MAG TPA: universal stress protein [Bryobacteraceae bacterium]|jgi:nucleotide-binding universal stress UspA family protein|nr:universal stress protein [Bryobacteraceae bacterium]
MTKIRNILFPIDFSPESTEAAEYVKQRARQFEASITVLHVADPKHFFIHGGDLSLRPLQEIQADLVAVHEQRFRQLVAKLFDAASVASLMRVGDEAETITSIAEEKACDVIMLPMKHQSLVSAVFEESVPAKVMELSDAAVWTVQNSYSLSPYLPYFSTLCALDFHPDGSLHDQNQRIVETAKLVSQQLNTKLTFVHVIAEDDMQEGGGLSGIRLNVWLEEQLLQIRREVDTEATYVLEHGNVPSAVIEAAKRAGAGLIITGRSHSSSLSGRARSTVLRVVRSSPCPLLSVR